MEKDFRSSLLHKDVQLPNAKSSALPFHMGLQSTSTRSADHGVNNRVSMNEICPDNKLNRVSMNEICPDNKLTLPPSAKEPHGWLYCLPRFRQSFISGAHVVLDDKLLRGGELPERVQATIAQCSAKQFLIFDQSGDKTTMIYSSVTATPIGLNSWNSNLRSPYFKCNDSDGAKLEIWSESHNISGPNLTDELNENCSEAELRSDVREDTEEINALLCSDDENDLDEDDDDEEMSTGHSPNLLTGYEDDKQDFFTEEDEEEVASSGGPTKRQKISQDGQNKRQKISQDEYDARSLMDTASSTRTDRTFQQEDYAESKCADDHGQFMSYNGNNPKCGMKRSRKERIRETVEVLQSIIPGGKGKDSVMVLEESIRYLRSLKLKANSLGLVDL